MPTVPSSQSKVNRIADSPHEIKAALLRANAAYFTLSMKVDKLHSVKSTDPTQQFQSDVICDLYDLVRELQLDLFPSLLGLPDVGFLQAGVHNRDGH